MADNVTHVAAGRAYVLYGYAMAWGSGQVMGLWNIFYDTTLRQTGSAYYVVGTCY